jgi:hypothetical protein
MSTAAVVSDNKTSPATPGWLAFVREKVLGMRYGVVEITVHDGHVTQIERTEKTRLRLIHEPRHGD